MIVLTAAQANQVRGLTVYGHALAPVPLTDGMFTLPEACAVDPSHVLRRVVFGGLTRRSVATNEYSTDEELLEACAYEAMTVNEMLKLMKPGISLHG